MKIYHVCPTSRIICRALSWLYGIINIHYRNPTEDQRRNFTRNYLSKYYFCVCATVSLTVQRMRSDRIQLIFENSKYRIDQRNGCGSNVGEMWWFRSLPTHAVGIFRSHQYFGFGALLFANNNQLCSGALVRSLIIFHISNEQNNSIIIFALPRVFRVCVNGSCSVF